MWFVPVVALLLYLSGVCEAEQKTPAPQRGPRQNETDRFRYESSAEPGIFSYCMFCPKKALDDSTYNYMQVQSCLRNYPHDVVWPEVLTPYEWEHRKFPFCNTGETPGCGAPPNITNIDWECERGYSGELHSLYFPCQGRCNLTGEVQYHLYCNTSFKWELTAVSDGSNCRIVERATEKSEDGQNMVLIIGLAVASVLCIVIVAIIVYCFCVRKRCKKKEMKNKLQQEQRDIELQEVHAQNGNRHQDHADPGQIQNNEGVQQQAAIQVPHRADSGVSNEASSIVVDESSRGGKKKVPIHNNLRPGGQNGSRSHMSKNTNNTNSLPTVTENRDGGASTHNTVSLGSQVSDRDLSQTIPKQTIGHHSHQQPHNLPSGSSGPQAVDTGLLDSPQITNNDLTNNSLTSLGNHRSQGFSSINTSGESSLPQNRSHASTNNSPSNVRNVVNKCDVSIHADINGSTSTTDDNESDAEPNESSKLLPKENNTDRNMNERTGLLAEYDTGGRSMDSNVDIGAGMGAAVRGSRPGGAGASSGSGRSERSESDGQPSSLGSNLSGSSREPVEHADDEMVLEPDLQGHNSDHTEERPRVQVVTNGKLKVEGNKFYVMKDDPFTIAARTIKPYKQAELKVKKEGSSTQFLGRSTRNELPDLPNVIRVDRATADDEGVFSWSLLSDLEMATGTIEIVVLDKETEKRPEEPLGASITEHVMEAGMPATQGVQNEIPPQGLLSYTPKLDPNSFANDQPLSGQNSGTTEKPGITNDLVKGERSSLEFGEMPFNDLNLLTFSDRFRTREGPSGSSVPPAQPLDRSSIDVEGEGTSEHETARKTVVNVSGPHNCSAYVRKASKTLMTVLKKQKIATFRLLAEQHGVDITWLHTLQFLEDPDCVESESVVSLLHLLSDRGLRLGHLLDYFYSHNLPDRQIVKDILKIEHTDCAYCSTFNS